MYPRNTGLIRNALKTLGHWQRYPRAAAELRWCTVGLGNWSGVSPREREFEFRDPGWTPDTESWAAFQAGMQHRFRSNLESYETRIRRLMESRGYIKAPVIRNPEQFEWLALYQLMGKSAGAIAKMAHRKGQSMQITKAIESAAARMGLKLRPGKRGRSRQIREQA